MHMGRMLSDHTQKHEQSSAICTKKILGHNVDSPFEEKLTAFSVIFCFNPSSVFEAIQGVFNSVKRQTISQEFPQTQEGWTST